MTGKSFVSANLKIDNPMIAVVKVAVKTYLCLLCNWRIEMVRPMEIPLEIGAPQIPRPFAAAIAVGATEEALPTYKLVKKLTSQRPSLSTCPCLADRISSFMPSPVAAGGLPALRPSYEQHYYNVYMQFRNSNKKRAKLCLIYSPTCFGYP